MFLKTLYILAASFLLVLPASYPACAVDNLIAAVMSSDQPRYREAHNAFLRSMAARGYNATKMKVILQTPNPDHFSLHNAFRKVVAYQPSLIIAYGTSAAEAAAEQSKKMPVVSVDIYSSEEPVAGVFGVSSRVPIKKLLKASQQIGSFRRIGVVYNSQEIGSKRQLDDIRKNAAQQGMRVTGANVNTSAGLDYQLAALMKKVDLIFVTESSVVCRDFERIVSLAKGNGIPVISTMPDAAQRGALASLEISPQEQGNVAADMAVRILEGATVGHLPLLPPNRVELHINLRVAKELELVVPLQTLSEANNIIH